MTRIKEDTGIYTHKNGLSLRKLSRHDLSWLLGMRVGAWVSTHTSPILDLEDQQKWYDSLDWSRNVYLVMTRDGGVRVAYGYFNPVGESADRSARVGMMVGADHRGSGWSRMVPEAVTDFGFEMLNFRRLEAEVLDNNPAALKFDLDVGYRIEGRRRAAVYKCGRHHDSLLLGLLRDEWASLARVTAYGGSCCIDYKERKPIDRLLARYAT